MNAFFFYIRLYLVAMMVFLSLEAGYIRLVALPLYSRHIGSLMAEAPNLWAAVIFYLLFVAGLVFFAAAPAVRTGRTRDGLFKSALFGIMTYGTYGLSNLALINGWPMVLTITDMLWGAGVSLVAGGVAIYAEKRFRA